MTDFVGRVDSVFTRQFSASIAASAAAGATTLTVVDGDDLDPSGQLQTPWDDAVYAYEFDGDVTVTLDVPLASAAEQGETLVVWDPSTGAPVLDTVAHVAVLGAENADDVVEARVAYSLIPLLPEGIRADGDGEAVTVRTDGPDYVVAEVLGQAAVIDGTMIDPTTAPPAATDGLAPAENPAVTVRPGIGSLFVVWEPIENADPVSYDVYAVPAADVARLAYPPLATDHVGSSDGTGAGFRALPDGTVLSPDASYAVAVYARDKDGQCTTSATPVTASPAKVNSEDLALNALTVGHLTGNDALFIALQAEDIVGVTITGSTIVGTEFKTASSGAYWRLGATGATSVLEAVPPFAVGAAGGLANNSADGTTSQILASVVASGRFVTGSGIQAGVMAATQRTRASSSDPWGSETTIGQIAGDIVQVVTPNAAGRSIVIDAKGDESTVGIHGDHIDISTYALGGDSVSVSTGVLTLGGDESVAITGPSITIGGQTISDTGWVNIPLAAGYEAAETGAPQYRLKNGVVYLRGSVQQTATGQLAVDTSPGHTIGTLPVAARPVGADVVFFGVPQNPAIHQARLFVWTNGTVKVFLSNGDATTNTGTAASNYVSLTGSYPV